MKLIMFHGKECPKCHKAAPIVDRLEKELKVKFTKREIWHHPHNTKMMLKLTDSKCKRIPMFINTENNDFVCGPTTYAKLKSWLLKQMRQHRT